MNVLHALQHKLRAALTGLLADDPAPYAAMLKPAADARFGDYQANCAMSLAKVLGQKPREIAELIVGRLDLGDMLEAPEIAGPGFINLRLRNDWLARSVQTIARDERLGVEPVSPTRTFVIDYSSPNVAKPMHVGHLRSTIIGDSLARLLRFLGHKVITDNHLGDWGTQFGMLLYGYKNFVDLTAFQEDPVRELARLYLKVRQLTKAAGDEADEADEAEKFTEEQRQAALAVLNQCRQETARLHAGDEENLRLWKTFMPACHEEINRIYRRLDVHFDHTLGESFYQPQLPGVVESLLNKGVAWVSRGAVIIPPPGSGTIKEWLSIEAALAPGEKREGPPPALVRKSDGAFTYMTTDLATIQHRAQTSKPDAMLYVVDFRQSMHFQQLFHAARAWGYDVELEHISFGAVLGKDRKPLQTRKGQNTELNALLDAAVRQAAHVYETNRQEALARGEEVLDLSPDELAQVYEVVGIGAVKYADLSQNRTSDYVYDEVKMTATDGNTATYMQYAYVRNRGIFRKGEEAVEPLRTSPPLPELPTPYERALAVQLVRFSEALASAATDYRPSLITSYLWDLAKAYSGFFVNCPVLKAETPQLRQGRLLLCDLTAHVIQRGLDLLGIRTIERM
jgi:arginyl-tRNA synthetase